MCRKDSGYILAQALHPFIFCVAMTMSMKLFSGAMLLSVLIALSGCANDLRETAPVATEPDLVGTRIAKAAEKASSALDTISGIEQQRSPITQMEDNYSNASPELMQPVSINWTGPIEQITETLASKAGLSFKTRGGKPPAPLIVTINAYQRPLVEILRDVGLQAGQRADLSVNGLSGFVEISYAPAGR